MLEISILAIPDDQPDAAEILALLRVLREEHAVTPPLIRLIPDNTPGCQLVGRCT